MERLFEELIQGVLVGPFGSVDGFIDDRHAEALRHRIEQLEAEDALRHAGIGQLADFQKNTRVRSDRIFWMDPFSEHPAEKAFFQQVDLFVRYLNLTCFTSINAYEFHLTKYDVGAFYDRHVDQFRNDSGRQFSLICYLNENWCQGDGGELALFVDDAEHHVAPLAGRSVFFRSNEIEHAVLETSTPRLSVTGWLKTI